MSQFKCPMATSTPFTKAATGLVLKEKQLNAGIPQQEALNQFKSVKPPKSGQQRKSLTKENAMKPLHHGPTRNMKVEDEEKAAKRRQQAIEAMKIQEQRRMRMCQQVLADELEKLGVSTVAESGDSLIEKNRAEAKKLKEKRILAFIAEQEIQKKNCEEKVRPKFLNLSSPTSFIIKTRRCQYKPKVMGCESPLPKVSEEQVYSDSKVSDQVYLRDRVIIRYSKDEIRSLNPYGYYFM